MKQKYILKFCELSVKKLLLLTIGGPADTAPGGAQPRLIILTPPRRGHRPPAEYFAPAPG